MATQDSILGLFTSPQQYQQALQTEALSQGMKMAQLSPLEAGRAMGYAGAAQVGRGLVGAMGGTDPALQLQSLRTSVLQGVNPNDSASLAKAAQALAQAGDQQGAFQLAQAALSNRNIESQIAGRTEERQAQRALQLQMAQEKNQTSKEIAADRNALMAQIAQMNNSLKNANSDVQRQLIEQKIEDLKGKAAEKESALQSQAIGRVAAFDSALDTLDIIAKHPGKKDVVGAVTGGVMSIIPGTNAAGFASQLETFKAQTFIPQVSALKGMGALSDAEGKKLTAAVGALDTKMKPAEFDASLNRIRSDLEAAKQRAAKMPGMSTGTSFNSVEEATRANLPKGTIITIGGRRAVVE
jgi:hypothetical protein